MIDVFSMPVSGHSGFRQTRTIVANSAIISPLNDIVDAGSLESN